MVRTNQPTHAKVLPDETAKFLAEYKRLILKLRDRFCARIHRGFPGTRTKDILPVFERICRFPLEAHDSVCNSGRNRGKAIGGRLMTLSCLDPEFPAMPGAFEHTVAESACRERPKGMRTNVLKGVDMFIRAHQHDLHACRFEGEWRVKR